MLRHTWRTLKTMVMARNVPKNPLIVVLGATGTGKSQLAVDLAKRFNGEIINGDAMQMYKGLPIVTNKVTAEEQQGIPHHLLGFIGLDEEPWRVGQFKRRAQQIIREIRSRGHLPVLVGGTHYYTQNLLFDHSLVDEQEEEGGDLEDGASNQQLLDQYPVLNEPTESILQQLKEVDPEMAERWHPKDRRRIQRSLEIFLNTGTKASEIYAKQKESKALAKSTPDVRSDEVHNSPLLFWVHSDSEVLKERLDSRVNKMIHAGLLDEVKTMERFLHDRNNLGISVDQSRGIWVSIGFKEFEPYLQALRSGIASQVELDALLEQSIEQTKAATRQYAKRQVRWIRLKLITALLDGDLLERLYLLDATDILRWNDNVSNPAIGIGERFLEGQKLQNPAELSSAAKEILNPGRELTELDSSLRRECKICNTTVVISKQWDAHLKSRRHKALVKKSQKKGASEWHRQKADITVAKDG